MRELRWDGCVNIRDLGGLPLTGGGQTRRRVLVRADAVTRLSSRGLGALREYGVSTIVDLRCPSEGDALHGAVRIPVFRYDDAELVAAAEGCEHHGEYYVLLLERSGPLFAEAVEILASAPGVALFHCSAGRDRTGLLAALVLLIAGVRQDAIIADYLASRAGLRARSEQLYAAAAGAAEREALDQLRLEREQELAPTHLNVALGHVLREYGGAAGYLRAGGIDARALDVLLSQLVALPPACLTAGDRLWPHLRIA